MPTSSGSSQAPAQPRSSLRPRPRISYAPQYRPDGTSVNSARRRKELRGYDADEEEATSSRPKRKKGAKGKGSKGSKKRARRDSDEENDERAPSGSRHSTRTQTKRGAYKAPWRVDGKLYRHKGGPAEEAHARIPLFKHEQARYDKLAAEAAAAADEEEEESSDASVVERLLSESETSDAAAPQTPPATQAKVLVPATPEADAAPWAKAAAEHVGGGGRRLSQTAKT